MSKLPADIAWSEEAKPILDQTDKTSAKAVATALRKAAEVKATKAAAMAGVKDWAKWAKETSNLWCESFLMTLFPTVMALCADKDRPVQLKADEAGLALMEGLSPLAVDAMLPLLFKEFDEHRWQTKLAAVKMFAALARTSTKAVSLQLPKIVTKLMEVSQDPKPAIKEEATKALRECCRVIDNADVAPLIDTVISANMNPETEGEACLDRVRPAPAPRTRPPLPFPHAPMPRHARSPALAGRSPRPAYRVRPHFRAARRHHVRLRR